MSTTPIDTTPYWSTSAALPQTSRLGADTTADVVVVGGGVTGLSVAYLLAKQGMRVVVLERGRCASADSGHTSAHLTMVSDVRLGELVKTFGRTHAQATWDAGFAALATIDEIVRENGIDAGFAWVDGYLHSPFADSAGDEADTLRAEAALAGELGFDAEYLDAVVTMARPGIRFPNQARVHPRRYLAGLVEACTALGGRVHEHSEVETFSESPLGVRANGHTVTCSDIVIATHNPIVGVGGMAGATLFQTKLALYSTYVVAGRVAKGVVPDALWWDTADPYQYVRVQPQHDHDVVIVGGEDHKTGQELDTVQCYRRLESRLRAIAPAAEVTHHWSGQVIETPDGLPYIGQSAEHQYSATGYGGNGLTFGTIAGVMIADAILGRANPWTDLFHPGRKAITRGLWDYVKENADYPYYMIRDRFAGAESRSLREVAPGQGRIVERNGGKVAAYRDAAGALVLRSAICPHMGCTVAWNTAERTWDCPCHGSRFSPDGTVISGPAEAPLASAD